jgi:hypothetical protein
MECHTLSPSVSTRQSDWLEEVVQAHRALRYVGRCRLDLSRTSCRRKRVSAQRCAKYCASVRAEPFTASVASAMLTQFLNLSASKRVSTVRERAAARDVSALHRRTPRARR